MPELPKVRAGPGESVPSLQSQELRPRHHAGTATPRQPTFPDLLGPLQEFLEAGEIPGDPVIPVVALQLLLQRLVLNRDRFMPVDVVTSVEIRRPRGEVAAFAADPDNATAWYQNIKSVEWKTARPVGVGSRVAFVAQFLGRRLAYTYEVLQFVPGEQLVMSTREGPFPMETTYLWEDSPSGGTRMTLRNRGGASGFSKVAAPVMGQAMRRANRKDLMRLKQLLESET